MHACFSNGPGTTDIHTLSLHDALPISSPLSVTRAFPGHRQWAKIAAATPCPTRVRPSRIDRGSRSEEHTSELQSRFDLVCRLLLEKKKIDAIQRRQGK